jgi:glycosyltransferase involved in cell wall biosynthesis
VPAAQVTHYLSGATFGFSPLEHHQNHELACPTKLYEYVHAGIPIVTSDVIESARFVTANKVGTVFPARDGQAVVTAVKEVLENPAKYRNSISNEVLQATVWPAQTPVIGAAYERAIAMASQRQD